MIKLSLVTFVALPYPSAEGVHMAMMAGAFSKTVDFELVSPMKIWRPSTASKSLKLFGEGLDRIKHRKFLQLRPENTFFLNSILSKDKTRVYYCRQSYAADFFLKKGRRVIWELHGLPSEAEFEFLKQAFNAPNFIALVVITNTLKSDVVGVLGEQYADSIHILPDAADIDRFDYLPMKDLSSDLKIGYIGSNYPGKGWEIIEKLPEKCKSEFHIYGFSHDENPFSNVKFYGKVPYSQIPKALNTFDIGLLPNQPDVIMRAGDNIGKYTSPMKLFEYMASGKVMVASDLPVIREILTDEHNALLVPHDDVDAWLSAIDRLEKDRVLYKRLQEQAYKDVCDFYSYNARVRRIIDIVNN